MGWGVGLRTVRSPPPVPTLSRLTTCVRSDPRPLEPLSPLEPFGERAEFPVEPIDAFETPFGTPFDTPFNDTPLGEDSPPAGNTPGNTPPGETMVEFSESTPLEFPAANPLAVVGWRWMEEEVEEEVEEELVLVRRREACVETGGVACLSEPAPDTLKFGV